jgi:hypothetical protein
VLFFFFFFFLAAGLHSRRYEFNRVLEGYRILQADVKTGGVTEYCAS